MAGRVEAEGDASRSRASRPRTHAGPGCRRAFVCALSTWTILAAHGAASAQGEGHADSGSPAQAVELQAAEPSAESPASESTAETAAPPASESTAETAAPPASELMAETAAPPASQSTTETAAPSASRSTAEEAAESNPPPPIRNPDPWEPFNRVIFQVNEWGDIYFVKPVAQGWSFLTPSFFRDAVTNFNTNLEMPVIFANNVLQLKPRNVRDDALRFFFDMTFGLAGLIDVATYIDIPQNDEDFGQTLGYWGTPSGPYLVLPVYGPSNVRDGFGRLADSAGTLYFSFLPFYSTLLVSGVEVVNLRSFYIEEIDANRTESFDYYVFLRNAYMQNRRKKVASRRAEGEDTRPDQSLYEFDDELEEDYDEDYDEDFDEDFDDEIDEDLDVDEEAGDEDPGGGRTDG